MKKPSLLIAVIAAFVMSCNPRIIVTKIQLPETGPPKEGQVYMLPKKALRLGVTISMYKYFDKDGEIIAKSQARTYGFYVNLDEEDNYLVQVDSVSVEEKILPDYSQAYRLSVENLSNNFFKDTKLGLTLSENGILKEVNTSNTSHLSGITSGLTTTARVFANTLFPLPLFKENSGTFGFASANETGQLPVTRVDTVTRAMTLFFWIEPTGGRKSFSIDVDKFLRKDSPKVSLEIEIDQAGATPQQKGTEGLIENAILYCTPALLLTKVKLHDDQYYPPELVAKGYGYNTEKSGPKELESMYISYPQLGTVSKAPLSFKRNATVDISFLEGNFGLSTINYNNETLKDADFENYQKAINELNLQLEDMRKARAPKEKE